MNIYTIRHNKVWEHEDFGLTFFFTGLKARDREEVQNEWMQGKVLVIVATISFGMGVDKANVR